MGPKESGAFNGKAAGVLKNLPPKYFEESITPVPTAYFIDLHNPSFWAAHATRYGYLTSLSNP